MTDKHQACSDLLPAYLAGDLAGDERRQVEEHVAGCADCSTELHALEALTAPSAEAPLSEIERARLHRAVSRQLFTVTAEAPRGWRSKVLPLLGAAALVAALAVFVTNADLGGMDEGGDAATSAGGADQEASADLLELGGPPIASVRTERSGAALEQGDSSNGTTAAAGIAEDGADDSGAGPEDAAVLEAAPETSADEGPPRPRFTIEGGAFNRRDVIRFGRTQQPFTTFARAYRPGDVDALRAPYAAAIASAAATSEERALIEECSAQVLAQSLPVLPAFGAYGRLDKEDVLLLGFVFATGKTSPLLDRYMIWVWPRANCDAPRAAISGKVR